MNRFKGERPKRPLCDEVYPDDGVDPRTFFSKKTRKENHATDRLIRTVENLATTILMFELEDPVFEGLEVMGVAMIRNGTAVEVVVCPHHERNPHELFAMKERLPCVAKLIRAEVAKSLQRRRAVDIVLRL